MKEDAPDPDEADENTGRKEKTSLLLLHHLCMRALL
jgi:hypothetical protein